MEEGWDVGSGCVGVDVWDGVQVGKRKVGKWEVDAWEWVCGMECSRALGPGKWMRGSSVCVFADTGAWMWGCEMKCSSTWAVRTCMCVGVCTWA